MPSSTKPNRKQVSVSIDADLAAALRDLKATIPPADVDTGMVGA